MPIMYKPSQYSTKIEGESLTEVEFQESTDINRMMKNALNGMQINGSNSNLKYGYDDTTLDAVTHRIQKENTERELHKLSQEEYTEEELKQLPDFIKQKFGFNKIKKVNNNNDELNDDNTKDLKKYDKKTSNKNNSSKKHDGPSKAVKGDGPPREDDSEHLDRSDD